MSTVLQTVQKGFAFISAAQEAMEIIPTTQHILDNYDVLTIAEKEPPVETGSEKATVYRTPNGELSVRI